MARAQKPKATPTQIQPRLVVLLGAGIAVGIVIWFLQGRVESPPPPAPAVASAAATSTTPAAADAQPAATILSTAQDQSTDKNAPANVTQLTNASSAAANSQQSQAVAALEPANEQPQRSPLAALTDEPAASPAPHKAAKKAVPHPKQKADSDIRLLEALVSHVNGEAQAAADEAQTKKLSAKTPAAHSNNAD